MKPDEIKKVKKGDLLLFKGNRWSILSWLIRWGTNSIYTHVGMVYDKELFIESTIGRGVCATHLKKTSNVDVFRYIGSHTGCPDLACKYIASEIGSRYDFLGLLSLAVKKLFSKLGFPTDWKSFQRSKDYFCSELVISKMRLSGYVIDIPTEHNCSPADIANSRDFGKVIM